MSSTDCIFEFGLIADIQYGDIDDEPDYKFFRAGLEQVRAFVLASTLR